MVFGHNLRYMAPFDFSRAGFCMVFRCASFVFHAKGQILEPRIRFWIPRSTFWAGERFGPKKWSRKKLFCGGMILWWGFRGIHPAQMNSMVPGSHMGRLLCPQTPLKNKFQANSKKKQENCRWPLPPPCGLPYSPLQGLAYSPYSYSRIGRPRLYCDLGKPL